MNEALESQESMELATLRVPRMTGSASGGVPPASVIVAHRVGELVAVHVLAEQVVGVAGVGDLDAAQHLACDDLDVLVVQVDALGGVDVLDRGHEGVHRRLDVGELAQLAEVDEAAGDLVAGANLDAVLDAGHETHRSGDAPSRRRIAGRAGRRSLDGETYSVCSGVMCRVPLTPREVGLAAEDLLVDVADDVEHAADGREALRDVVRAGDAAGVDGAHRELRARLADGLRGDDADGRADVDGTRVERSQP
jgi:hypothetical protein